MPRVRGRSNASILRTLASDTDDPLTRALQPSSSETSSEREERLRTEREAKRISDEIDEELRRERVALKKKKPVRLLLLGQSESGKSTTLKNFQIHYAPQSWRDERAAWKTVIQLNLIRSVALVIDAIASLEENAIVTPVFSEHSSGASSNPSSSQFQGITPGDLVARYSSLMVRLKVAERILQCRLSPSDSEEPGDYRSFTVDDTSPPLLIGSQAVLRPTQEFFVRSSGSSSWKSRFLRRVSTSSQPNGLSERNSTDYSFRSSFDLRSPSDVRSSDGHETASPSAILYAALPEMRALWLDPEVQGALLMFEHRNAVGSSPLSYVGSRIEDFPGFFLPHADRIASPAYEPSDGIIPAFVVVIKLIAHDVIRARLRTMGVQEHRFTFERGIDAGREWRVYDIGGSRSQEDSITLWRTLCRSPLLTQVQLILFLNKVKISGYIIDLLRRKLAHGVRIARYVTSFADRSNDPDTVCKSRKDFKQKFKEIQRQHSPRPRPYYVYLTAVTDTKATGVTLGIVREGILRANLQKADFI
ncbi:hypothetical protein Clacol_007328 [Clathrus columnatus]|uniref:Uncharacterized protein n=1 Tax=Clathrus columnatus TaxID=1419009 RepID=A0AAV5AK58_9AGAM|nr:hypothetical protein Clacol_007328 [Clathrus columnatus]